MNLSARSVPAVFCCMSVHLSTAPSAAVPFSTLTEVLWMVVEMSCVQNQSQSVCVRNCGDQKKGRLKACRRGWNWIVVSLYVRGSGCWCRYRYVVDSCLGNRRSRRERTGISVGSACRVTDNEGNFKCIIMCVHRHHRSHSADMFRPRLAIVQYSSPSGITCIAFRTALNVFSDTPF
jgi:hypothetical protein